MAFRGPIAFRNGWMVIVELNEQGCGMRNVKWKFRKMCKTKKWVLNDGSKLNSETQTLFYIHTTITHQSMGRCKINAKIFEKCSVLKKKRSKQHHQTWFCSQISVHRRFCAIKTSAPNMTVIKLRIFDRCFKCEILEMCVKFIDVKHPFLVT